MGAARAVRQNDRSTFPLLSCVLVVAAVGWFRRRKWGWVLAVFVIAVQVAGDLVNLLRAILCGAVQAR